MKKKTKVILCSVIGALVVVGAVFGILFATKSTTGSSSGTVGNFIGTGTASNGAVAGSGRYDWKRTETSIPCGTRDENLTFYSNNSGDYIYDFKFYSGDNTQHVNDQSFLPFFISYYQSFSWHDDLEVFFVFDNGYTTAIETSHIDVGTEEIYISAEDQYNAGVNLYGAKIVEVWVRTVE